MASDPHQPGPNTRISNWPGPVRRYIWQATAELAPLASWSGLATLTVCLLVLHARSEVACRYWAGRVALRENRARQHPPAVPRGSEAARPNIFIKSSWKSWAGGAPLQFVPGVRSARAGCRAVRDSTLVAWYRSLRTSHGRRV